MMGFSTIYLENVNFSKSQAVSSVLSSSQDQSSLYGSFIQIILDVQLIVKHSIFDSGYSHLGGAIYVSGNSSL